MKKVLNSLRGMKTQKSGSSPRNSTTSSPRSSTTNRTSISDIVPDDDIQSAIETIQLKPLRQPITPGVHNTPFSANLNPVVAVQSDEYEYRYLLQNYTPQKKTDSIAVCINHMDDYFKINTDMSELLIYLPICIHEDIYSQPDQLRDFLKAVVAAFKPRPVHIVLTISDELNRHQIYKEKYMREEFFKPMRNSSSLHLDTSDDCRYDAKKLGDNLIESLSLENIAEQIGCKITQFRWGELTHPEMTSAKLKACFLERMRISEKTTEVNSDISITSLSDFVSTQFNSGVGFATAVQPKLNEVSNIDLSTFTEKTNVKVSDRSNKKYIFEEVAHMMQVYSTGLFHVTVHAQDFKWRKFTRKPGTTLFGEVLHHWTCELLTSYLAEYNKLKRLSENLAPLNFPHYITVGRYPKSRAEYVIVKSNRKNEVSDASIISDNNERSLHQMVIDEVETRRGLQTLSKSEKWYYEQALVATGRKSSDKTSNAADKKAKKSLKQSKSLASLSTVSKDKKPNSSLHQSKSLATQLKTSGSATARMSTIQTKDFDVPPVALDDAIVSASAFQNVSLRTGPGFFDNTRVNGSVAQDRSIAGLSHVFDNAKVQGKASPKVPSKTSVLHIKTAGEATQAMRLSAAQSVSNDKDTPLLIPRRKNSSAPLTDPDHSSGQQFLRRRDSMGLPRKISGDESPQIFTNRRRSFNMLIRVSDDEDSHTSSSELLVM